MKTTITKAERLQLIGLMAIAETHNRALVEVERAALALLAVEDGDKCHGEGDSDAKDWIGEAVFNECGVTTMLKRIGVTVSK